MRTLHTSSRPVSRQGTIVFDPRVPATPRVPLRCVRYYDAKIRFRSTKTLYLYTELDQALHTLGGLCTLDIMYRRKNPVAPLMKFCFVKWAFLIIVNGV